MNPHVTRRPGSVRRLGVCLAAALLVLSLPRAAGAAGREMDWAAVFRAAQAQYDALGAKVCAEVAPGGPVPQENVQLAAAHFQVASVYDFLVRNFPEKGAGRAGKVFFYLNQAVVSYERAYACVPGYEARRSLQAAIVLVNFALKELKTAPAEEQEKWRPELLAFIDRIELPPPPPADVGRPPQKEPVCEGPPPVAERKGGCSLGADASPGSGAAALVILAAGGLRRRRRRTL